MKKNIILMVSIVISCLSVFSQNFPGKDVDLLVNKEIKVLPDESDQKYGYKGFFKDTDLKRNYEKYSYSASKYDALVNKVFKVLSYEPYVDIIGTEYFRLKIENSETGIIYFKYNPKYYFTFPFEVLGGIEYPEGYLCKHIEEKKDKFTDDITLRSPISEDISFTKVINKGNVTTYIRLEAYGSTACVGKTGVIILFKNGDKLEFPTEAISADVNSGGKGFMYSAFISLKPEDIKILSEQEISDIRLYIFDKAIVYGKKYKEYLKCIAQK